MATYTLTPTHYYQYENGVLTATDPATKSLAWNRVTGVKKTVVLEFNIPSQVAHKILTDNSVQLSGLSYIFDTYSSSYNYNVSYNSSVIAQEQYYGNVSTFNHTKKSVLKEINAATFKLTLSSVYYEAYPNEPTFTGASLVVTYTDSAVFGAVMSPSSGWLKKTVANDITVGRRYAFGALTQYTVASGQLKYKLHSASTYSTINFTGNKATIPANTLGSGVYDIYAHAVADDGSTADTDVGTFDTTDTVATVACVSPINQVTYGAVTFSWSYDNASGTPQYAFDIEISDDGNTWVAVANHVISDATIYEGNVNTSGTKYWRVRGYNQDDVASSWDSSTFVNIAPPATPTIVSISTSGRPVVQWSSSDQVAYQVIIGDIDSGQVYSSDKTYLADDYLADGTYTVKVRVINQYGYSSDWAEQTVTIQSGLTPPDIEITPANPGAQILITGTFDVYYIKRNGVLIGKSENGVYVDLYANGKTEYTIIAVDSSGNDVQVTETVEIIAESNQLIDTDGNVYYVNHRIGSPVGVSKQVNAVFEAAEYIGASRPEHHFSKMREGRYTVVFKDYVDTENLLGKTLYYADMYGNGDWCALVSIGRVESRYGNETTAELQTTYYDEEIDYD